METLSTVLKIPDLWQHEAVQALLRGHDVIVDAPTGAGKTYIFELLLQSGFKGKSVFTVPTRALANDKYREWQELGMRVGITTGDLSEHSEAPVIVATLETQKSRFLHEEGPDLLVVDEYQMIADASRGVNYELILAMAPPHTQLLLLSGSVGNPQIIADWLRNLGRSPKVIQHHERPVPLEEVFAEALTGPRGKLSKIPLVQTVQKALLADLAPLLIFTPMRQAAENIALQIARELPNPLPLELTPEQQKVAGDPLGRLLKTRVAYHHSGLDYQQRGGLIEPLAKKGQLRVIVATLGLASGINFSVRSVLVHGVEYRREDRLYQVRPDELLQMFGRAGRRGLDDKGSLIITPESPRLLDGQALKLDRTTQVDWPSLLSVMQTAVIRKKDPIRASKKLRQRLFRPEEIILGWDQLHPRMFQEGLQRISTNSKRIRKEFLNTMGQWERFRPKQPVPLELCQVWKRNQWKPALTEAEGAQAIKTGRPCLLKKKPPRLYGVEYSLASWSSREEKGDLTLSKWLRFRMRESRDQALQKLGRRRYCRLEEWEDQIVPALESLLEAGTLYQIKERKNEILLQVDIRHCKVLARIDQQSQALLNPQTREQEIQEEASFGELAGLLPAGSSSLPVPAWAKLGLITLEGKPTRRGVLFSFFQHGDGLAIAAALEEPSYDFSSLIYDLANIRGGHRFSEFEGSSSRLGTHCRLTYGTLNYRGYLKQGLPNQYGEGVSEVIQSIIEQTSHSREFAIGELRMGDIERAFIEWKSLLLQIVTAPEYPWERWLQFQDFTREFLQKQKWISPATQDFPPLTYAQQRRPELALRPKDF